MLTPFCRVLHQEKLELEAFDKNVERIMKPWGGFEEKKPEAPPQIVRGLHLRSL